MFSAEIFFLAVSTRGGHPVAEKMYICIRTPPGRPPETMKKTLLALLLCLAAGWAASARNAADTVAVQRLSGHLLAYRAEQGDTLFYDYLPPVWVFPRHARQKSADMRKYYRLVYNFNKVYPYALAARHLSQGVDAYIAANNLKGIKRDKYINEKQKELMGVFEKPLRNMSISQGKLLIRLCDREMGMASYSVIKDYKNGIAAGFWQGIAKMFGHNLKDRYDPAGADKMTEYLVEKWNSGEFPALYYSIFFEEPKPTDIPLQYR